VTDWQALQVAGISGGMALACLIAMTIASPIFEGHTRAGTAREAPDASKVQDRHRTA
jgi:hypothetical protein